MWFWWFMLACGLLVPVIVIIAGRLMWKHYPQEINRVIGYRTKRSMRNEDTWKFAHEYCGKIWWIMGWIMLVPSIVAQIPFYNSSYDTIGIVGGIIVAVQVVALLISIIPTEIALKKNFFDDGTRR